jgi:RecA-family ATPase
MADGNDIFAQAAQEYRATRDRIEAQADQGRTGPRLAYDRGEAVGMDDMPTPPLDSYADEVRGVSTTITPKAERKSAFRSAADLEGVTVPDRPWLVPDLIPGRTVTLLYGDGGTGKSLLSLQLAVAVATGGRWIGRECASGLAVFLSAEDEQDELHRRLIDVARAEGIPLSDMGNLIYRSMAGEDALLASVEGTGKPLIPSSLYNELDAYLDRHKPALLVLDTLADLFPGNENDKAQVRQFVSLLKGLAILHDCTVVMLAHPSLSGMSSGSGTSGNTAWNNSARSRLYFERIAQDGIEANPDARVLRTMKANYGPKGGEIGLTWRNGVFALDATETGLDRMAGNAKAERVFLKLVQTFAEQGRPANPMLAPADFEKCPEAEGIRKAAFTSAREALLSRGVIRIVETGPESRRRKHLEVAK